MDVAGGPLRREVRHRGQLLSHVLRGGGDVMQSRFGSDWVAMQSEFGGSSLGGGGGALFKLLRGEVVILERGLPVVIS